MRLRMIDAIDLFGIGGYIDTNTGRYVSPKSMSVEHEVEDNDNQHKSVLKQEHLVAPVIRSTYISYTAARKLGVSHDMLITLGFTSDFYQDMFYPSDTTISLRKNGYSDTEWTAIESVSEHMRHIGRYKAYVEKTLELRHDIIINWLSDHGIEVY